METKEKQQELNGLQVEMNVNGRIAGSIPGNHVEVMGPKDVERLRMERLTGQKHVPTGKIWTPEAKAEFRKRFPKKLNKFGEWFFSEEGGKQYIVVNDPETVYGK